jgi:hypothetical protein
MAFLYLPITSRLLIVNRTTIYVPVREIVKSILSAQRQTHEIPSRVTVISTC